jgi:hypothetical protein
MKLLPLLAILLLPVATISRADDNAPAPVINGGIDKLTKQIDADVASGKLTKPDADELRHKLQHVEETSNNAGGLTPKTRRDLRNDLQKISDDLARKEQQAKAISTVSPTP